MNQKQDIRILTERFLDGKTTLQEERTLYRLYSEGPIPPDLIDYREMMLGFQAMSHSSLHDISPEKAAQATSAGFRFLSLRTLAVAASLLLLVGWGVWHHHSQDDECVAYIYGKRVTDQEVVMKEMQLAISSISDDGGSEVVESQLKDLFE